MKIDIHKIQVAGMIPCAGMDRDLMHWRINRNSGPSQEQRQAIEGILFPGIHDLNLSPSFSLIRELFSSISYSNKRYWDSSSLPTLDRNEKQNTSPIGLKPSNYSHLIDRYMWRTNSNDARKPTVPSMRKNP